MMRQSLLGCGRLNGWPRIIGGIGKRSRQSPALHEETGSIPWAEIDKAYDAAVASREALFAVLGKEADQ